MSGAKVAIVEDEFLVALQLEDIIMDGGHRVVATLSDLKSVEDMIHAPDVALVDLNLRDGPTGKHVAQILSERFGTRIIYVTANSGQIGLPAQTAIGVVHKPFSPKAIEQAVAYAVDESSTIVRPADLQPLEVHALRRAG